MRIPLLQRRVLEPEPVGMMLDGVKLRESPPDSPPSSGMESQIDAFWASLTGSVYSPRLINQVWAADRCIQLNSQQIASMPLRFFGRYEPAWVSSPDPNWYPNGIGSAVFAIVYSLYQWGDAFLHVTDRYANGLPSAWTVLAADTVSVKAENGERAYRIKEQQLDPEDVVQISRNPTGALRGTPALSAFGSHMVSAIASADLTRTINQGGTPNAVLKSQRKLTKEQAEALQEQWAARATMRRGAPAVLPPDIDFETLAYSPTDLMLVDVQQFDARVIAAAFGVPPFMLNVPLEGGLTYQSPAMLFEVWWRSELRPTAKVVSDALSAELLPRGSWVEFDARDLLAPDFAELVDAWKVIVSDMGAATIDEFRAAVLRMPPQSEQETIDDLLTTQATTSSISAPTESNVQPIRPTAQEVGG